MRRTGHPERMPPSPKRSALTRSKKIPGACSVAPEQLLNEHVHRRAALAPVEALEGPAQRTRRQLAPMIRIATSNGQIAVTSRIGPTQVSHSTWGTSSRPNPVPSQSSTRPTHRITEQMTLHRCLGTDHMEGNNVSNAREAGRISRAYDLDASLVRGVGPAHGRQWLHAPRILSGLERPGRRRPVHGCYAPNKILLLRRSRTPSRDGLLTVLHRSAPERHRPRNLNWTVDVHVNRRPRSFSGRRPRLAQRGEGMRSERPVPVCP